MCRLPTDVVRPHADKDGEADRCWRDRPSECLQGELPTGYSPPMLQVHLPSRAAFVPWLRRSSLAAKSPAIQLKQTPREVVDTRSAHTSSARLPLARDRDQQAKLRLHQGTAGKLRPYRIALHIVRDSRAGPDTAAAHGA